MSPLPRAAGARRTLLRRALRPGLLVALLAVLAAALVAGREVAAWGIVRPFRRALTAEPPDGARALTVRRGEVTLDGWYLPAREPRRVPVVYLHGIADNRASGFRTARRLREAGHDVLLFDARGHGSSGGTFCTFGVEESLDLTAVLDATRLTRAVALGYSLGGAVALQAAAHDPRIAGVIAVSAFSDLESVVTDRAPWPLRGPFVAFALARVRAIASFDPYAASPLRAAPRVSVPVLLVHGAEDQATPPEHSRRIAAALRSPHELVVVPGVGHDGVLGAPGVWDRVSAWLARLQ